MRQDKSQGPKLFFLLLKFQLKLRKAILLFPASSVLADDKVKPYQ